MRLIPTYKTILPLLFSCGLLWASDPDQGEKQLWGTNEINFGMNHKDVIALFPDLKPLITKRGDISILEFKDVPRKKGRIDKLRIFFSNLDRVFWIEEQFYLKWDLQKENITNLENHQREFKRIMVQLRNKYGQENLTEQTEFDKRNRKYDFVTAVWQFENNHWIHVIFEPQDWTVYPELNKIIVIYRDSELDPRKIFSY